MIGRSEEEFRRIFIDLKENGKLCSPRGLKVLEIENYSYQLGPYVRFCNFQSRKLNLEYLKTEFLWYLRGDLKDLSITNHAQIWKNIVSADQTLNSNYGYYLFNRPNGGFDWVVQELTRDKDSRRASTTILDWTHLSANSKDVPCTYALNFRIRENRLNMSVHMRSQDAIFGMGNDAICFSFIHEMVFVVMKLVYPELELGNYHHIADSFHVYERHFEMLEKLAYGDPYIEVECPRITTTDINLLLNRVERHPVADSDAPINATHPEFYFWLNNLK